MKFSFSSKSVGDGFAVARVVKPDTGDFCLQFTPSGLVIFSYDKRRYSRSVVGYAASDFPPGSHSEECYVTLEKTALFDSDLETVTVKLNDASVSVKAEGGGQSRQASLKRRAKRSKRTPVPDFVVPPGAPALLSIRNDLLEEVLGHLMCSAIVGKTEEEMRVNQIHFYSSHRCATSMTRFYGTVVTMDSDVPDFSIVGTDAPAIRTFASRAAIELITLSQDKNRLYVSDGLSCLSLTRVSSRAPAASLLDESKFSFSADMPKATLSKALSWACMAVQDEGTSRVRFEASDGQLVMFYNKEEISRTDCSVLGGLFSADFQVKHLRHIVDHIQGDVRLRYAHSADPTLLSLSPKVQAPGYGVVHYMKAMVER